MMAQGPGEVHAESWAEYFPKQPFPWSVMQNRKAMYAYVNKTERQHTTVSLPPLKFSRDTHPQAFCATASLKKVTGSMKPWDET